MKESNKLIRVKIAEQICRSAESMILDNWDKVSLALKETDDGTAKIGINADIKDFGTEGIHIKVKFSVGVRYKDEESIIIEDPRQEKLGLEAVEVES